jgi:hypothetical protein
MEADEKHEPRQRSDPELVGQSVVRASAMARSGTVVKFEEEDSPVTPSPVPVSEGHRPEIKREQP